MDNGSHQGPGPRVAALVVNGDLNARVAPAAADAPRGKPASGTRSGEERSPERVSFSFGRNWQDFIHRHLNAEREQIALQSMTEFLELPDLRNRSFIDVGCGSGLFSLAAHRLGARSIVSLDVDPFSVRSCEHLREGAGNPDSWKVVQGSVLDQVFLQGLGKADVVYAWGSLHHTGNMWQAIRNTAGLVERKGLLYLSIYNKVKGRGSSEFWLKVKKLYNRSPQGGKWLFEAGYALRYGVLPAIVRLRNPFAEIGSYSRKRGMSYWTDVRDWLGGYPYEFASADEVFRFCTRELHLELANLRVTNTLGTNEFLFYRSA
jgi:2-polyprenyl-6-hydroxyphenyl methylase/3-demethylubiquinone-9 3-methyltransferase